jgi:tetratricopeptide (TPR) repeat protein
MQLQPDACSRGCGSARRLRAGWLPPGALAVAIAAAALRVLAASPPAPLVPPVPPAPPAPISPSPGGAEAGAPPAAATTGAPGRSDAGGPQPLTAAERQAAQLAADYLAEGPAAWWPRLARDSWLRGLGRAAAVAEIEARAGMAAGSRWTLQAAPADFAAHGAAFTVEFPSDADDTLWVGLVEEDGQWKIESLRVAAEPGAGGGGRSQAIADRAAGLEGGGGVAGALARHRGPAALLLGLLGAAALAAAGARRARRPKPARPVEPAAGRASFAMVRPERQHGALALGAAGVALLALAGVLAATAFAHRDGPAEAAAEAAAGGARRARPEHVALRALLPLRRALTGPAGPAGASAGSPAPAALAGAAQEDAALDALAAAAGDDAAAGEVALLWRAQHRIDRGDLAGGERLLAGLPVPAPAPLAELLRARLALLRLRQVETALAYERALAAGVAHEGMLIEAVQALYILGFEDTAKRYLHELAALGARGGEAYYDLADLALLDNQKLEAHQNFRIAWKLEPIARAELLSQSLSAFMLQDRDLRHLMSLGTFAEPVSACGGGSRRPLVLAPGMRARLLGEELRVIAGASGSAGAGGGAGGGGSGRGAGWAARAAESAGAAGPGELWVPGACDLAPAGTVQDSANAWQEERDEAALARLPALRRAAALSGALAQPVLRRQTEQAAVALAERQRWAELIEITEELARPAAILPARLARLRAAALAHGGRKPDARQLLVRLALGDKASKRADPAALYQLADLLEQEGEFDQAIRLVGKANSVLPSPPGGDRILRLQMEKRLASSMERWRSPHFVVSYPLGRGEAFAKEAARVLEAERQRLQKWIPLGPGGPPVEVRLLPFEDFELGFSQGGEVMGLYDGVVRVPLGSLRVWKPFAVSIMSHELAHAMIAQRTADRAPHWFHEGLAQHVEMQEEGRVNPIADYRSTDRLLAFPLIEPALQSFSSAVWVGAAYDEALWTMNYIEARYGVAGIHRLLDAFRAGRTTGEALAGALGVPVGRFDQELWEWCLHKAPRAWRLEVVRYDGGAGKPREL